MSSLLRLLTPSPATLAALLTTPEDLGRPTGIDDSVRDALAGRLARRSGSQTLRLDAFTVERGITRFAAPFCWTVRGARRTVGTSALRLVEEGRVADPLRGAAEAIEILCDRSHRGLARRGALGTWLAAQPRSVRTACAIEASSWAIGLAQLVDADVHRDVVAVGVPDAWVELPTARTTLHGRVDAAARDGGGMLRVRDGVPGCNAEQGLVVDGVIATLEILSRTSGVAPSRVIGAWPDAGVCLVVTLDAETIRDGLRSLVRAVPSATPTQTALPTRSLAA